MASGQLPKANPPAGSASGFWARFRGLLDWLKRAISSAVGVVAAFFAPILLLLIALLAKFSFVDPAVPEDVIITDYFRDKYTNDIWIDLIITSYATGIGWYFAKSRDSRPKTAWFMLGPTVAFFLSSVSVLGAPKVMSQVMPQIETQFWVIWVPALIGVFSAGISGVLARE